MYKVIVEFCGEYLSFYCDYNPFYDAKRLEKRVKQVASDHYKIAGGVIHSSSVKILRAERVTDAFIG